MTRRLAKLNAKLVVWVLGFAALNLSAGVPADQQVRLPSEVAVSSPSIALSDLLPLEAPEELRSAARTIGLGAAPEPGTVRQIARAEISQILAGNPGMLAEIVLPDEIIVRRTSHRLSNQQIAAAISAAVGADASAALSRSAGLLQTPIYFSGDEPGLKITQIDFDPLHQVTRLRLWTSKEPENLPFFVTVPGRLHGPDDLAIDNDPNYGSPVAALEPVGSAQGSTITRRRAHSAEKLVKTGVETMLVIEGSDYRITSTVVPLEAGALGEQIRVRDPVTRRILTAQVAGPGLLRGTL